MRRDHHDMRHHLWALAPVAIGLALRTMGVPGAFVIGLAATVIGIAISCSVMTYETSGPIAAAVRFPLVLMFIACGGVVGGHIGSSIGQDRGQQYTPAASR